MTLEGMQRFEDVDSSGEDIEPVEGFSPSHDRRDIPQEHKAQEEIKETAHESIFDPKIIQDVFERVGLVAGGGNSLEDYVGAIAKMIDASIASNDYNQFLEDTRKALQGVGHPVSSPIQAEDIAPLLWEEMGK